MATQDPSRMIRNVKRNSKVSVLIDITDVPFRGALVYGTAELDYEDIINKRIDIFERTRSREDGKRGDVGTGSEGFFIGEELTKSSNQIKWVSRE